MFHCKYKHSITPAQLLLFIYVLVNHKQMLYQLEYLCIEISIIRWFVCSFSFDCAMFTFHPPTGFWVAFFIFIIKMPFK